MGVASEVAATVVEKTLAGKPLRIKILTKKPVASACGFSKQASIMNNMDRSISIGNVSSNNTSGNRNLNSSIVGTKRKLEVGVGCEMDNRLKMDRNVTSNCKFVIGKLLKHRFGFPFKRPVDPIELRIPDYFHIIKKPMDLGTIKQKLDDNKYRDPEDFESDVRLTFSNAMHYNAPDNCVHQYAKELLTLFDHMWRPVKVKISRQLEGVKQPCSQKIIGEATNNDSRKCLESFSSHAVKLPGETVSSNEVDPRELAEISCKKKAKVSTQCESPKHLSLQKLEEITHDENQWFLKSCPSNVGKLPEKTMLFNGKDHEELTEVTIKKEQKVNKHCGSVKPLSSQNLVCKTTHGSSRKYLENTLSHVDKLQAPAALSNLEHPVERTEASIEKKVHMRNVKDVKEVKAKGFTSARTCRSDTGTGSRNTDSLCVGLSMMVKVKSENSKELRLERKGPNNEIKSVEVKKRSTPHLSKSEQGSYGDTSCLDEERAGKTSDASASGYSSIEGSETVLGIQLSPSKALRAAMLKSRFADTIFKAQHNTLLQSGGRVDSVNLQHEKERMEKKQQEEKAKIEAQIRAAERAARVKAESELKRRREQERIALEKMEKSVDLDDNFHVLRELEGLIGRSLFVICKHRDGRSEATACFWDKIEAGKLRSPLEQLGLFIKAEHLEDDDEDDDDEEELPEEGEVIF